MRTIDWGLTPYAQGLESQLSAVEQRARGEIPDTLFLCQHPDTVTLGRTLKNRPEEAQIAVAIARENNADIVEVSRGGRATLHLPGQIVGYPIIQLDKGRRDLHKYLRAIEEALIQALSELAGVKAGRKADYTGVWIGEKKIASIGIAVKRWVTYHGFALNINPDLSKFHWIVPCGLSPEVMTSLEAETDADCASRFEARFAEFIGEELVKQINDLL